VAPYTDGVFSIKGLAVGLVESIFPAVLLIIIASLPIITGTAKWRRALTITALTIFAAFLWTICFAELFVGTTMGCRINEAVLRLVVQTDRNETAEFLTYAVGLTGTWQALGVTMLPAIGAITGILMKKMFCQRLPRKYNLYAAALLLLSAGTLVWAHLPLTDSGKHMTDQSFMLTPGQLIMASRALDDNHRLLPRIAAANDSIMVTLDRTDGRPAPQIILIIGESANKHHSSFFGYPLPTDRELAGLRQLNDSPDADGRLIVFTDAVTGDCTTNLVMKRLLSTNIDSLEWADRPLLPAVLRKGGYHVAWFDNQSTPYTCSTVDYSSVFFINDSRIERQCFDRRNDTRFEFDGQLIDRYLPEALEMTGPSATFFHLMGQHVQASRRYPASTGQFTTGDYAFRPDLNENERTDMMHYDNATAYVDSLVAGIMEAVKGRTAIVIYLPDHAEEIYDWRHRYGRTHEPMSPERARALFEIPMAIYMTREYINTYPDMARTIECHANSRIHSYDIPDLILHIAGISGHMASHERSIASEEYDETRPRMIDNASHDYDALFVK